MKHTYVINPVAGDGKHVNPLIDKITAFYGKEDAPFDIYITRGPYDAAAYVKEICEKGEPVRFYACGGDGTLNEVANGLFGYSGAELGLIPCGSGNDFVKVFGDDAPLFHSIEYQYNATPKKMDVIQADDRISMNICSIGFDAKAGYNFTKLKKMPMLGGKTAYNLAVGLTLMGKMSNSMRFTIDGEKVIEKESLICVIANGNYYGGSFHAAPYAKIDDGLIDLILVDAVSRLKFINLVNIYKQGNHIGHPKLADVIHYERCSSIKAESPSPFVVNFDGECKEVDSINFQLVKDGLVFCIPQRIKIFKK